MTKNSKARAQFKGTVKRGGGIHSKGAVPAREVRRNGIKVDRDGFVRCRGCGCTEREPCNPPCAWCPGQPDMCDSCMRAVLAAWHYFQTAHRPSWAALRREVERMRA